MYARPGKDPVFGSVTVRDGRSFHHSTNDLLNDGFWHRPFDVFCQYRHGGDPRAAVKAAAAAMGMSTHPAHAAASLPAEGPSGSSGGAPGGAGESLAPWADPQPLPPEKPAVLPFDYDLLPAALRPWVRDIAERVQCPPDYPAVGAMVAMAGVVGRKIGIRPKRHDDWQVVPNLWGAAIGRPGIMKTPALQEPLKPLKRLEIEASKAYAVAVAEFEAKALIAKEGKKVREGKVREALKKGRDADALAAAATPAEPSEPIRRRYLVNDSTVEKLGELLNQNPNGLLCYRDELIGLLRSLDKEGQEGARGFYLEAWNGTNRYTYDRIGRGTLDIESACISVIGCIQPGPLGDYMRAAMIDGSGDDGLMQRFQLAVWPDVSGEWVNIDRYPDTAAKNHAYETYLRLDRMTGAELRRDLRPSRRPRRHPLASVRRRSAGPVRSVAGGLGAQGSVGRGTPGHRIAPGQVP